MAIISPELLLLAGLFLLTTAVAVGAPAPKPAPPPARTGVVAYVPNWIDLATFAPTIPYADLTQINLAFENPTDDAGTLSFNAQNALLIAGAHAQHVPVFLSIGGGAASGDPALLKRYTLLLGTAQRPVFVKAVVAYLDQHQFDGLDIDLEGPGIGPDYGAFVHDVAVAVHADGKRVTAAVSQGYGGAQVPNSVFTDLDFVNIMAYDATGTWAPNNPGQHSSLAFAEQNVTYWLGRGLPKAKAILGVPFYGYGFGTAFRNWSYPYSEIVAKYPGAEKVDQIGSTIWYNGIPTIQAKARYAVQQGLAGVMIWSLDNDVPGPRSLLAALTDGIAEAKAERTSQKP
jgi:chitinase